MVGEHVTTSLGERGDVLVRRGDDVHRPPAGECSFLLLVLAIGVVILSASA